MTEDLKPLTEQLPPLDTKDHQFWWTFGFPNCPSFEGKRVLDLGSGSGGRIFQIVAHGAREGVGVEPIASEVELSTAYARQMGLADRTRFVTGHLEDVSIGTFDVILSENTFEHVMDIPTTLAAIRQRLNPGGLCYIGFGPLYHAPDGDHGWLRATLPGWPGFIWPWGHVFFYRHALRKISESRGFPVHGTRDWPYLDLNQHTYDDYIRFFNNSGLRIVEVRRNHATSAKGRLIALAGQIPFLRKYCTMNIAATLTRDQ